MTPSTDVKRTSCSRENTMPREEKRKRSVEFVKCFLDDDERTKSSPPTLDNMEAELTEGNVSMWLPRSDESDDDGVDSSTHSVDISISLPSISSGSPDLKKGITKKRILSDNELNQDLSAKRSFMCLLVDEASNNKDLYNKQQGQTTGRYRRLMLLLAIVLFIVGGIVGGLIFLRSGKKNDSSSSTTKTSQDDRNFGIAPTPAPTRVINMFPTETPESIPTPLQFTDAIPAEPTSAPTLSSTTVRPTTNTPTSTPTLSSTTFIPTTNTDAETSAIPTLSPTSSCTKELEEEMNNPLIVLCIGDSITAGSGSECPEDDCTDERFGDSNGRDGAYSMPANLAIYLARGASDDGSPISDTERTALYENSYVLYKNEDEIDRTLPDDDDHVSVFSVDPNKAVVYNLGQSGRTLTESDKQYKEYWKYDFVVGTGTFTQLVRADGTTTESLPSNWNTAIVALGTNDATLEELTESSYNEAMTELLALISETTSVVEPAIFLSTTPPRDAVGVANEKWDPWNYDVIMNQLPSWIRDYTQMYALGLVDYATLLMAGFIDQDLDTENIYLSDGLHPNNVGYDLMAAEVARNVFLQRQEKYQPCSR